MKKKILIIFLIGICFLNKAYAMEINTLINCQKNILTSGEETTCNISANITNVTETEGIKAIGISITPTDGIEITSIDNNLNTWQGDITKTKIGLYTHTSTSGNTSINIATIHLKGTKINSDEAITLSNIKYTNAEDNTIKKENVTKNIRVADNDNKLKNLIVANEELSPSFNSDNTEYTITTNNSSINIDASANSEKASISGLGNQQLNYGTNILLVNVTAEDKSIKTYKIVAIRQDNRDSDNKLKSLVIDNAEIKFTPTNYQYSTTIDSKIEETKIIAEANSEKSTIEYTDKANEKISLELGETKKISIIVTAENETKSTYTIDITRKDNRNSDSKLKSLKVSPGNITFNPNILSYTVILNKEEEKLKVDAVTSDSKSQIKYSPSQEITLKNGENKTISIIVTAENKTTTTYEVEVIRPKEGNKDNLLKSLEIKDLKIEFDPKTFEYNLQVDDDFEEIDIKYEVNDPKATATITGGTIVDPGKNKYVIKVTAENGEIQKYTINVQRGEETTLPQTDNSKIEKTNKSIKTPLIITAIISIVSLGICLFFEFKKRKKVF